MATDISRHPAPTATANERHHKGRKPFSSLMKRLASLKNHTANSTHTRAASGGRAASCPSPSPYSPYYPYKAGKPTDQAPPSTSSTSSPSHISFGPNHHASTHSISSTISASSGDRSPTITSEKSRRPAPSAITATTATASTFSSPTPSIRSLTTTLTTIQSTAPGSLLDPHYNPHPNHHHNPNAPPTLFHHQFPSTPTNPPSSPGPTPHSASTLHPINYSTATAGGLLTDNASIITLASSSKRRRRHSLDTDASVRALAPSSLWGGSRESLPLSVLSTGFERGSLYGATSFTTRGDASSMRDFSGSIMGELSSTGMTIAGNRESLVGFSRRSTWVENQDEAVEQVDETVDDGGERRRSLSVGDGEAGEGQSMRDGSSNVGVWHGVFGHKDEGEK